MSALNYEFLARPTRMEGKNVYCDIKCVRNVSQPNDTIVASFDLIAVRE